MHPVNPGPPKRNTKSTRKFSNDVPPGLHYLPPLNPRSEEFVKLFRTFLTSKDERANILALAEPDAKLFIELIDRAFRAAVLDPQLRQLASSVLRRLCGRIGHIPESYLLSDKFDVSGGVIASGGFADVRMGVFKGKNVAVKSLRVSPINDKAKIRKQFCKEVAVWKNLFHPNVLNLIGVPDTFEKGGFSVVSEWMANGNIVEYVRNNAGNHLQLLAGAVEGLSYLHKASIVHGDLKGANVLITNTNPVSACLADFGFTTIVHDPGLEMESSKSTVAGGTTPFMAPEFLVPSRFGLDKRTPTKGTDVYAMAMVIYQILTGSLPYGNLDGPEVIFKVLGGEKPLKPANSIELGLSDRVWRLLEDCWKTDFASRPSVADVSACVKSAASTCGILSPTGDTPQRYEDPDSDFCKFDHLFSDNNQVGAAPMKRFPGQGSTLTDASSPDSLLRKLSGAPGTRSCVTEPPRTNMDILLNTSLSPVFDRTRELRHSLVPRLHLGGPSAQPTPKSPPILPGQEFCTIQPQYPNDGGMRGEYPARVPPVWSCYSPPKTRNTPRSFGKAPNTPITQASERVHTVQPQVAAREFDEHRRPRQTTISQGGHSSGNLSAIEVGRDQ